MRIFSKMCIRDSPGSGVAAIATSANNLEDIKKQLKIQTIGHDKVNQLRHVRFFKDIHGITEHMRKHADSLRPKFEMILDTFERELKGLGAGSWYSPKGGYFITYETLEDVYKRQGEGYSFVTVEELILE